MRKTGSLRGRWIMNTVGVVAILGFLCAAVVTAVFAVYYYSAMESDMQYRARNTTDFFAEYSNLDYNNYYQSCIHYANTFADKNKIELQFINNQYHMVATSYGNWAGDAPSTSDIAEAFKTQDFGKFIGKDPVTGERIMAFSKAMVYSNGEVIGVLRYVTSTRLVDRQILIVAMWAVFALLLTILIVWFSSNYYIRSIMIPVAQITEKAKRIAGGSYGMIIQTKYDDEIGELAETINEMSFQISQNEKVQRDFISSLSHELRTPLTSITGWSETILLDETLDPDTQRGMRIILRETNRLTEMVVDLLNFNKIQDGKLTLNMEDADIRAEFEDTVFMYSGRASQDGIQLHYLDNEDEIPIIPCDAKKMRQVFLNILDNAAKHGASGKKIDASIHFDGQDVFFLIRDYGPGIPEDELPLVKKKFYKGSSDTRGTGIGLAVCDEIVQMHNGTLTLENAEGGGTLVTVTLPAS
mgnify:CR=1 FL=1